MSAVLFFRLALLLPFAIPLVSLFLGENQLTNVLTMSLKFSGVQYLLFAIFLYYRIGRLRDPRRIRRLLYWAPVLFIPVQVSPFLLLTVPYISARPPTADLETLVVAALVFSPFILALGYGYVILVDAIYTACSAMSVSGPD